ncbi:formylglycine-generating enzyme family protein [Bacteriovoracaceae bacterium]|nr:formylglycine-generating enzyme family protein [Bacteriovoracaceae bacterium]
MYQFLIIFTCIWYLSLNASEPKMVYIKSGLYIPFYKASKDGKKTPITISAFYLDKTPVTNSQYLAFVKKQPRWKKSKVKQIFAEKPYLSHWKSDFEFQAKDKLKPVKYVSWFAAMDYCESLGKELPSVLEWEYVGSASKTKSYAIGDPQYREMILKWYSKPSNEEIPNVGQGEKNYWGVKDMHGLHWEWTSDFNTSFVTGESRADSVIDRNKFCGSGSLNAKDKLDYGAFMRFAFRSSLKGNYTIGNLGFRCVKRTEVQK